MGRYKISDEQKAQMLEEIKYYFKEERDEDLGILGVENLYDFFLDLFGDTIYNIALVMQRNMPNVHWTISKAIIMHSINKQKNKVCF